MRKNFLHLCRQKFSPLLGHRLGTTGYSAILFGFRGFLRLLYDE